MYRLTKAMLAEFSYFLEKYFHITSAFWSVIFIALCSVIVCGVVVRIIYSIYKPKSDTENLKPEGHKERNFFSIYLVAITVMSYIVNRLMLVPQTWISKLHRVMGNFQYVLSFPSNYSAFFDGLKIPSNVYNQKEVFRIAMYLNENQWDKVFDQAGGGSWYFEKVHKAISEILYIGDTNMSLGVLYQGIIASIPFILIVGASLLLFYKKKKRNAILVFVSALISVFFTFGGAVCLCVSVYGAIFCWYLLQKSEKQLEKVTS